MLENDKRKKESSPKGEFLQTPGGGAKAETGPAKQSDSGGSDRRSTDLSKATMPSGFRPSEQGKPSENRPIDLSKEKMPAVDRAAEQARLNPKNRLKEGK